MAVLCIFLSVACLYDYRWRRIPNFLVVLAFLTGAGTQCYSRGLRGGGVYLLCVGAVLIALYPLFKIGVLGAGDVKLFAACSGYFPCGKILIFLFVSLLIAAMISLLKMIRERSILHCMVRFYEYVGTLLREGKWRLYIEDERQRVRAGICLAGPMLGSALLCWGGIY